MCKLRKGWWRMIATIPAVVLLALALNACSDIGGRDDTTYEKYKVTEVHLTDGRILECVYFGAHAGYDCNWDTTNDE